MHLLDLPAAPSVNTVCCVTCDMAHLLSVWRKADSSDLLIGPYSGSGFTWACKDVDVCNWFFAEYMGDDNKWYISAR